jgi:hypothetical protein
MVYKLYTNKLVKLVLPILYEYHGTSHGKSIYADLLKKSTYVQTVCGQGVIYITLYLG